ncbi:unnamed protein product, partial [Prunus brigantina]
GFYPHLPSLSLHFSHHPFNHPILVKSTLLLCTKSGILGAQNPFPAAVLVKNSYFQLSPYFSFLPSFMVRSEEEKRWVYMLVRRWLLARQYLLVPWMFYLKICSFLPSSLRGLLSSSVALSFSQMLKPLLLPT